MPVRAYVGLPRHGKSYEVVKSVIVPAIRQGRRVITNLAGINQEAIHALLVAEGIPVEILGQVVFVNNSDVEKETFWRTDFDSEKGIESFIQPGDVVVLDEIWRYFEERAQIHPRVKNFFRMHGHMPHPVTGYVIEIALISQSIGDFNSFIKRVIEQTFLMEKKIDLGMSRTYIVHIFKRASESKSKLIRTLPPTSYDPKYFPCYKSHSQQEDGGADAHEENPDNRGNIFKGAMFRVGLPLALLLMISGFYFVWKFLHPKSLEPENAISSPAVVSAQSAGAVHTASRQQPEISDAWRVTGHYQRDASINVALQDSAGNIRVLNNPPNYKISAMGVEVELPEGGFATSWTALSAPGRGRLP